MTDVSTNQDNREWSTEPPSQRRPRRDWTPVAEDLRAHKGEWTVIDSNTKTPGLTSHVKNGNLVAFRPKGAFEARSTKNSDGTYDIHAVFVGESE